MAWLGFGVDLLWDYIAWFGEEVPEDLFLDQG